MRFTVGRKRVAGKTNGTKRGDMKKLFIPIPPRGKGGGSTFIAYLLPALRNNVTFDISDDWDTALMIGAEISVEDIESKVIPRKENGAKIIYRLDGIKHTRMPDGMERMKAMWDIADLVIFQSKFVQLEAENLWGIHNNSRVIYNGVDVSMFKPQLADDWPKRPYDFLYCEYSQKPHKKAQEAFGLMKKVIEKYPTATLTIMGKYPTEWIKQSFGLPQENVKYLGRQHHNMMPLIISSHKALLFPSENEPCSNLVLEAMASELLVIHKDSGCMPELCGDTQIKWTGDLTPIYPLYRHMPDYHSGRVRVHKYFTKELMVKNYLEALELL